MSTDHTHQDTGTSPTMTNGQRMPEDVWLAILRLERKRYRQERIENGDTYTIKALNLIEP